MINSKKAKALRKELRFHPNEKREYSEGRPGVRLSNGINAFGQRTPFAITGTIKATGSRAAYQSVKRNPALTRMVLAAPKLKAA